MTQHSITQFNSNDAGKLFVFGLLVVPPTIFIVGIIPVLFLIFGLVLLRKTGDFGHIETAARYYKIFYLLVFLVLLGICVVNLAEYFKPLPDSWDRTRSKYFEVTVATGAFSLISLFYIAVMQVLFLRPLRANKAWVVGKVSAARGRATIRNLGEIDIIKGERLRSFSVADELLKWAKLKDDGHITEAEFAEARRKLLERN